MDLKHLPSIVADDNKEEDDRLVVEEKSKSEPESESESESDAGLPGTTIYEFHNHPLFLTYNTDEVKVCDVCGKEINSDHSQYVHNKEWPMYSCKDCDYYCHVRCVISEIKLDKREKHMLFLCDEDDKNEPSCCVCRNFESAANETSFTYGCSSCSFYIHKSCINKLPVREITHEFHPDHRLKLNWKNDIVYCDACHIKLSGGFTYRCIECNFDIGLICPCASRIPNIRDERHEHLLTLFEKMYTKQKCINKCGLSSPDAAFLRCVRCDFSVHLFCSPLPQVIKFKYHFHSPLALKDYHIEDDFGEYYCDHCEGSRDPKECAYRCCVEGCPYVAELNCVLDEVVRSLIENHGEVAFFRTVDRLAANEYYYKVVTKGLFLHDVYKSSPKEELELQDLKRKTESIWDLKIETHNSDAIEHVRGKFSSFPLSTMDLKSEVVKIGKFIITKDFETMFSKLHHKYSDIDDKCTLSEGLKTIVLVQFVQLIHEMMETRILKITEEVLLWWLFRVLFVLSAGFKVDFVLEHMIKIRQARFDLKTRLHKFPELEDYCKEIEVITEEIEVQKAKLVKLRSKENESTELLLNKGLKDEKYWLLDQLDFTLETAAKGFYDIETVSI